MRFVVVASGLILAAGGLAAAYFELWRHHAPTIRGSTSTEFVPATPPQRPPEPGVAWPTYGYDQERTRTAPTFRLRPPFRRLWTFHGRALLEFPPVVGYGRVYITNFAGRLSALDAATGKTVWRYGSGRCGWASPALADHLVYETFIGSEECGSHADDGEVVAFDARTGRVRWLRPIGPTESSPLVARGTVYVGDWDGRVWALALAARTGRVLWKSGGHGSIYASPAIAYGRVYIGSLDGGVYAFGAGTGHLLWAHATGGYVYASPAIWRDRVLVGSYDHRFYAFDAGTGDVRWRFEAHGPISGAATVIDGLVYFSTFKERTYALNAASGHQVATWPDGKYSPAVADSGHLYLVGLGQLYALAPR